MGQLLAGALMAWLSGVLSVICYANFAKWMDERD